MNQEIPEEIAAMAFLIGQSTQIDSMMMEQNKELVTNTNTIKQGLNEYIQQQRRQQSNQPPQIEHQKPVDNVQGVHTIPAPQTGHYQPHQSTTIPAVQPPNDGQLELNLEPTKVDIIIKLLKEISTKLTKQNSMIEKHYANESKKAGVPDAPIKLGQHQ
jgi:hypothetical protein